jgi:aspartyl-tRNA(Asn)/glutamyl-tRNA(Gln) amidotransferase subunit A
LESASPGYLAQLDRLPAKLRIGWSPTLGFQGKIDPEVAKVCADAARSFEALGHVVEEVDLDLSLTMEVAKRNWSTIMSFVVFHRMAGQEDQLDPALVACAQASQDRRAWEFLGDKATLYQEYLKVVRYFEQYDLLLTPTVACLPIPNGRLVPEDHAPHAWDWLEWAPFSSAFNIFHNPAASVPAGFSASGLPIGLQIVGPRHQDLRVLQASRAFEGHRPWAHIRPTMPKG